MPGEFSPSEGDGDPVPPSVPAGAPAAPSAEPDYKDLYLRARAELDNYRKRSERDRASFVQFAGEAILRKLLDPVDALERAIADLERTAKEAPGDTRLSLGRNLEGLRAVRRLLGDLLASEGVEAIRSDGALFDPEVHEALVQVASAAEPEGKILQTLQTGYSMRGKLLRPARVAVSSGPPAPPPAQGPETAGPAISAEPSKLRFGRRAAPPASSSPPADGETPNPPTPHKP